MSSNSLAKTTPDDDLVGQGRDRLDPGRVQLTLRRRHLDRDVAQRVAAGGPRRDHRAGERARSGARLDERERFGPPEPFPLGIDEPRDDSAEQRPDLGRGDEVAAPAGPSDAAVEAVLAVQRESMNSSKRIAPPAASIAARMSSAAERTGEVLQVAEAQDQSGRCRARAWRPP